MSRRIAKKSNACRPAWRTWEEMPGEDLVPMPRTLALELVKSLHVGIFAAEFDDHSEVEDRFSAHLGRLERIAGTLIAHLAEEGLTPNADLVLRALVMAYEVAPEIPGVSL